MCLHDIAKNIVNQHYTISIKPKTIGKKPKNLKKRVGNKLNHLINYVKNFKRRKRGCHHRL